MRKAFAVTCVLAMTLSLAACGNTDTKTSTTAATTATTTAATTTAATTTAEKTTEATTKAEETKEAAGDVMTYDEFVAAAVDDEVVVETYVQAKQSWWEDKATVYTQTKDGAYFLYNMACTEADYEKLVPGTKIKVTGYKAEWSGEIEIADATFEIVSGDTYVAEATDVTKMLADDKLVDYQNQFVSFTGMTVEPAGDGSDKEAAYIYNYDGSGSEGDDLYFNVSYEGATYTFTVESYLCDKDSDVYKAVQALKVGDTVDMEGFLYWYEGVNPHITSVTVK